MVLSFVYAGLIFQKYHMILTVHQRQAGFSTKYARS